MTAHSSAAPEIGRVYARARQLAREIGRLAELFPPLWGSWLVAFTSGDVATANRLLTELFGIAHDQASPELLLQAHHAALPTTLIALGELAAARAATLRAASPCTSRTCITNTHSFMAVTIPDVCGHVHGAVVRAVLGFPDEAVRQMDRRPRLARKASSIRRRSPKRSGFRPSSATCGGSCIAVRDFVSAALPVLSEHGSAVGMANAMMLRGWAVTNEGRVTEGVADLGAGLSAWRATGSKYQVPYRLARAADAYRIAGDVVAGLALTAEALEAMERSQNRWVTRRFTVCGANCCCSPTTLATPRSCFERALAAARLQCTRLLELRAATSLARLWRHQDRRREARDLLAPIYHWFTEGFDAPDLKDAKALLDELA